MTRVDRTPNPRTAHAQPHRGYPSGPEAGVGAAWRLWTDDDTDPHRARRPELVLDPQVDHVAALAGRSAAEDALTGIEVSARGKLPSRDAPAACTEAAL